MTELAVESLPLPGLKLLQPSCFRDARGSFVETYREPLYREHGIDCRFVQDNHARSTRRALRGLHYQSEPGQAKLVRVGQGRIFDVVVDLRIDSPTFGRWHSLELDGEKHQQLFIPLGFAHGYCVLSDSADVLYKVSSVYDPQTERTLAYDDPDLDIDWPVADPIVSERDRRGESLASLRAKLGA